MRRRRSDDRAPETPLFRHRCTDAERWKSGNAAAHIAITAESSDHCPGGATGNGPLLPRAKAASTDGCESAVSGRGKGPDRACAATGRSHPGGGAGEDGRHDAWLRGRCHSCGGPADGHQTLLECRATSQDRTEEPALAAAVRGIAVRRNRCRLHLFTARAQQHACRGTDRGGRICCRDAQKSSACPGAFRSTQVGWGGIHPPSREKLPGGASGLDGRVRKRRLHPQRSVRSGRAVRRAWTRECRSWTRDRSAKSWQDASQGNRAAPAAILISHASPDIQGDKENRTAPCRTVSRQPEGLSCCCRMRSGLGGWAAEGQIFVDMSERRPLIGGYVLRSFHDRLGFPCAPEFGGSLLR